MGVLDDAIREHLDLRRAHGASESEIARKRSEALSPARRDAIATDAPGVDFVDAGAAPSSSEGATPHADPAGDAVPVAPAEPAAPAAPVEPAAPPAPAAGVDAPTEIHTVVSLEDEAAPPEEPREGTLRGRLRPFFGRSQEPAAEAAGLPEAPAEEPRSDSALDEPPSRRIADPDAEEPRPPQVAQPEAHDDDSEPPLEPDVRRADPADLEDAETPLAPEFPRADPEDVEPELLADDVPSYRPPAADPGEPPAEPPEEDVLEDTPDFLQETPEHDRLWFEQKPPRDFDFDD